MGFGKPPPVEEIVSKCDIKSWSDLAAQTPRELVLDAETLESGPPTAQAWRRFGGSDITLYRDSAAWCPYCQKTWMLLEEKRLPYQIEKINMACYGSKPRSFIEVQPSGTLPAAVIDGRVLRSSDAIILSILDMDDGPGATSGLDCRDDPRSDQLLNLERQHFSAWLRWLTGGDGGKGAFINTLDRVERELAQGPYFLGDKFTFVDCMYAPFLERMAASLAYFKGFVVRRQSESRGGDLDAYLRYPNLNRWFDAMESRPAYRATMADWYTHAHDLPPQLGGCVTSPNGQRVRNDVDALVSPSFEPLWSWVEHPAKEAAARLAANGKNVAAFAARQPPGFPPARADLADPNAQPDNNVLPLVDALLRLLADTLHQQPTDDERPAYAAFVAAVDDNDPTRVKPKLVKALEYLQNRVGVPRDMSFPAAVALRNECSLAVKALQL